MAGTTWYYNTSTFIPGDVQQIALQANATSLSTGRYSYSVQVVDERSDQHDLDLQRHGHGAQPVDQRLRRRLDARRAWSRSPRPPRGVILNLGDGGESLWFSGSPERRRQLHQPGRRLLDADQDQQRLHAHADRRHPDHVQLERLRDRPRSTSTACTPPTRYNGSNQLTIDRGSLRQRHHLHLQRGLPPARSRTRPARLTTFTFSGGNLQAVEQADGSRVTYTYDGSGRMTQVQDPRSNVRYRRVR